MCFSKVVDRQVQQRYCASICQYNVVATAVATRIETMTAVVVVVMGLHNTMCTNRGADQGLHFV